MRGSKLTSRRDFLKAVPLMAAAVGLLGKGAMSVKGASLSTPLSKRESDLVRMRKELERALEKPLEERKWAMVIDLRRCVGCNACTVSCIAENKTPPGIVYRPVLSWESGKYPNAKLNFLPRPCMQCDEPPCVPVCPVNATWKRPDGIVVIDYEKCIGCRYCVAACPYGARSTDFGYEWAPKPSDSDVPFANNVAADRQNKTPSLEYQPTPWYAGPYSRDKVVGVTRKCHFCIHRIESGLLPACVTTCIGGATYFGDLNDPDSLVSELIRTNGVYRLKEELGTEPSVFYITGTGGTSLIREAEEELEKYRERLMSSELRLPLGVAVRE